MQRLNEALAVFMGVLNGRFDGVERKLDTKADIAQYDRVLNSLDGLAKRLDDDDVERAAMAHQLDRHQRWFGQLARHTGVKLRS